MNKDGEVSCYFGVFDCYSPGCGCVPTLIMSGVFTGDDLYNVSIELDRYMYKEKRIEFMENKLKRS